MVQEKEVSKSELYQLLEPYDDYFHSVYYMGARDLVDAVLLESSTPFIMEQDVIRLKQFSLQMNNIAYEFLLQIGKPQSLDKIIKQVSKKTKTPIAQIERQLHMDEDVRFVQIYDMDRWLLAEWEIANDEIYQYLIQEQRLETSSNYIYQIMASQIQEKGHPKKLWIPEVDLRFEVFENGKVVLHEHVNNENSENNNEHTDNNEENNEENNENENRQEDVLKQELETIVNYEGEHNMNHNNEVNEVFAEVIKQVAAGVEILKERNDKMSNEVLEFFHENNLEEIHKLMEEKKANLEFQQELIQLIEKWKK